MVSPKKLSAIATWKTQGLFDVKLTTKPAVSHSFSTLDQKLIVADYVNYAVFYNCFPYKNGNMGK